MAQRLVSPRDGPYQSSRPYKRSLELPQMNVPKQVIVMRKDLGMRKGKMIAQGAHATMMWLAVWLRSDGVVREEEMTLPQLHWIEGIFTKICVGVDSEDELNRVHETALENMVVSYRVVDSGLTEFNGVATPTCCAIGPDWADRVDLITGDLKLL